jgi:hypothetical protein
MNAGPDVERLIAGWLVEEAPGRAPDRILESTASVIDRTKQRRFGTALWAPMDVGVRGRAVAAAMGVAIVSVGVIALILNPRNGVGGPNPPATPSSPADSAAAATPAAGPIQDGTYVGPTLRVADIVASINTNPTLSDLERRHVLDDVLGVGDGQTFFVSIDIRAQPTLPGTGQWIVRHTVDGAERADIATGCHFENDRLVVGGFFLAIEAFDVTTAGEAFTLSVVHASSTPADEAAAQIMFESGPFNPLR